MKNLLRYKHQRNKEYFKSKYLEKRLSPQIFLFYNPTLRYQFPNGMNQILNFPIFFFVGVWLGCKYASASNPILFDEMTHSFKDQYNSNYIASCSLFLK